MASSHYRDLMATGGNGPEAPAGVFIEVRQSDSAESIAYRHGHIIDTVWNHPRNEALRTLRRDPHVLLPGDRLFVPDRCRKTVKAATGGVHRFRRRGVPSHLTVVLAIGQEVLANLHFELEIGGATRSGVTDAEGRISVPVMPDAPHSRLVVDPGGRNLAFELALRRLDPITETTGIQGRLRNLGYYQGDVDGLFGQFTLLSVQRFQADHGLPARGEMDEDTRERLLTAHGC
jgi:hypothetical protein